MFKDLKEYQDITRIYNESVNISEEQRAINKIFIEEGFTSEEIEWLEENFDELWENELAQYTQECIVESFEGQNLTEEQVQQLDEVLGLGMAAKGIMKAAPAISKGLRKANVGIKKGLKAVGKKVSGGAKAIGTGIKDTARGAASVGKSALKKVGGALKKAAPIAAKLALPLGAGAALVGGINALRKRGKKEREAAQKASDAAAIKKGIEDAKKTGIPNNTTAQGGMSLKAREQAAYNRGEKAAQDKAKAEAGQKAGEAGAEALKDKKTETKTKPMSKIEFQNRKRFGDDAIDKKKAMNVDFKRMRKGEMSKKEFIDTYPKSQTAKKYNQSDKAYRDYKKGLKKEDFEHLDAYDMVLEYLFATDQVSTIEEAHYVMLEMDQQTIGEIVKEVKISIEESIGKATGKLIGGLAGKVVDKMEGSGSKAAPQGSKRYGTAAGPRKDELAGRKAGPKGSIRKSGTATAPMK